MGPSISWARLVSKRARRMETKAPEKWETYPTGWPYLSTIRRRRTLMNKTCVSMVISVFLAASALAQRKPSYDRLTVPQTRIDVRDLGYSPIDVIPDGESGITSLSKAPNGDIYGATNGTRSHLFVLNPQHGYVIPIGVIPGAT